MLPRRFSSASRRASLRCWRMRHRCLVVDVALGLDDRLVVGDGDILHVGDEIAAFLRRVAVDDDADQLQVGHSLRDTGDTCAARGS